MKTERKEAGWGFLLLWALAGAVGMFLGLPAAFIIGGFIRNLLGAGETAGNAVVGMIFGSVIATMQWLVLRRHIAGIVGWIPVGAIAGLGVLTSGLSVFKMKPEIIMAIWGAAAATLQWLVLRKKVDRAVWWIPVNAISWGLGWLIANTAPVGAGGSFIAGMILVAVITGSAMIKLLRKTEVNNCKMGNQAS